MGQNDLGRNNLGPDRPDTICSWHGHGTQALVSFKKYMPFSPSPLRLNIFRLFVILSLIQLYHYTPEIFLFSTATFKYTYRAPLRRIGQEYSVNVTSSTFQSLKRIQPLPVCAGFFICIRNSLDQPCVTMPS